MDPIIQKNTKWYYFNETFTELIGPFKTEQIARHDLAQYSMELDGKRIPMDQQDYWDQEFEEASDGEEYISPIPTQEEVDAVWSMETSKIPQERIQINTVDDLHNVYGLIDGGYITFVYGSRKGNFGGWDTKKHKFKNHLILMDSGGVRQAEYEPYKSRRKERRERYDYMAATYERVQWFREVIKADPSVYTAEYEGYEADDLIAILCLKDIGRKQVIAQDKDMFMVPYLGPAMIDHHGVPQLHRGLKLPKYAIEPSSPGSWALTQAIFGDKSDSIPRLLPSRSGYKELYHRLIKRAPSLLAAYWNCMSQWPEQFLINLRLVLLPHPTLSILEYDMPNFLFQDICTGEYWNPNNYDDSILEALVKNIKDIPW